ncbi:hypothetical protein [Chamaesiphon polymorphus]|uniref:Uncharacterized protein n=1 Tax=Chamaesiphon polymorphus CCALA 037 TaxID=2107692 RepID=A0A2T1FNG1_9CYAN|nr:hypothetical protein [Chamaesiphon polymorphus]PSB46471.1 hypothetical protein C7B77_24790 [Chamaesiphon polymorphus CCALA 037]
MTIKLSRSEPKIEQLTIWTLLERVSAAPEDANIIDLSNWIGSLELEPAGDALVVWADCYRDRAIQLLDEWQHQPSVFAGELVEPRYDRAIFDELVLGRMEWDLGDLVETSDNYYPTARQAAPKIAPVSKDAALALADFQDALDTAHEEDISNWGATIRSRLEELGREVSLLELQESIEMPLVQMWLALLLNGMRLEQRGDFYQTEQVWVLR